MPRFVFIMAEGFRDCGVVGNDGSVATVTVRFRLCWNFGKLMNCHSHGSGNLGRGVSVISDRFPPRQGSGFPPARE
ncbi:hypothetical protein D6L58_11720 [Neisseria gonorrhoeae]